MSEITRAICYAAAALAIGAVVATFAFADNSRCQKCVRRCERLYCEDVPTPAPTRTPTPATHTFGKTCDYELRTSRTITFEENSPEPTLICHTAEKSGGFIEVQTQNHGNATCADYWLQMYSPTGAVSEPSVGAQPGAIMSRVTGRYVIAVRLRGANNAACRTLTFTVR